MLADKLLRYVFLVLLLSVCLFLFLCLRLSVLRWSCHRTEFGVDNKASSTKAKAKVLSKAARADPTSHLARVCVAGVWLCCDGADANKTVEVVRAMPHRPSDERQGTRSTVSVFVIKAQYKQSHH
jgi:hypothetical protein